MIPAVERATRLRFRQRPVVLRRSRAQVRDYVIHKFDDDLPPAELEGAQAAYRLFGLIPDSLDLRRTMIDLLTEQVAGYFDPDSNALYIPTDIDLPIPGLIQVRTLVRPRVPREATLRRPHADLHRADPAPRAVRGRGSSRRAGVRVAGFRHGALRGRAGRVRDPPVVGTTLGRHQRRRLVRDGLGWRPLPGARAEEGEPRWEGGGRRARVVHAVG